MKKYTELLLQTTNRITIVEKDIINFIKLISSKNYVEGVVLLGGLGHRSFIDEYSDLDIAIFYKLGTQDRFFLPFEFHATINKNKYEFNIHQLFYEKEVGKDWDEGKREAYSRAKVLVDKDKRIKKLIHKKVIYDKKASYNRLIWIMQQYVWRGQIHSLRTFYRGYPEGAHDLLNECGELLVEALYILNDKYRPHKKWRLAMLTTMQWLPKKFLVNFRKAMLILDFSIKDVRRRINIFDDMYFEIFGLVKQKYPGFPDKPYEYYYKNFVQLKKDCFIQKTLEKLKPKMNANKIQELEGILCLNLISSSAKVNQYLK